MKLLNFRFVKSSYLVSQYLSRSKKKGIKWCRPVRGRVKWVALGTRLRSKSWHLQIDYWLGRGSTNRVPVRVWLVVVFQSFLSCGLHFLEIPSYSPKWPTNEIGAALPERTLAPPQPDTHYRPLWDSRAAHAARLQARARMFAFPAQNPTIR